MKQGQKKANHSTIGFPEDVIMDILLRLPSKSLARSRCVSKYWNTLITSPSFIKTHLHRASKPCHLLYQESKHSELIMPQLLQLLGRPEFDREEHTVSKLKMRFSGCSEFSNLDPPTAITDGFNNFKLVDSFNGISCLYAVNKRDSTSRIWLWNPAINDCFAVPEPRFPISSAKQCCVGFGFNPLTSHLGDFKVVSVTLYYEGLIPGENCTARAEIYSRRTNSWKELVGWFPRWYSSETHKHQVIFEEYICWSPYYWRLGGHSDMKKAIVSFDVVSEEFHEMALPDSIPFNGGWGCITLLDGCVSLLAPYSERLAPYAEGLVPNYSIGHQVWTMKEFGNIESWRKLYNINNIYGFGQSHCRPLGFARTDEALFLRWYTNGLRYSSNKVMLSYDTRTRTVDKSKTMSFDSSFRDCCFASYMESLIPVSYISRLEEGRSSDQ